MPSSRASAGSSGSPARNPSGPPSTMNPSICSVTITPPARRSLSSSVTSQPPLCVSSHAAASPAMPAPTTTTFMSSPAQRLPCARRSHRRQQDRFVARLGQLPEHVRYVGAEPRLGGGARALIGQAPVFQSRSGCDRGGTRRELGGIRICRRKNLLRQTVCGEDDLYGGRPGEAL